MNERKNVLKQAKNLRDYAEHFEFSDWNYTRDLDDLRPLHFGSRWPSIKSAVRYAFAGVADIFPEEPNMTPSRWRMVRAALRGYEVEPDGVLDNGGVITLWEETGEYIQIVQPTVGSLLGKYMEAHPDDPEIQAIAREMKRIADGYSQRIKNKVST